MKKIIIIFLLLTLNTKLQTLNCFAQCVSNVDFNTWIQEGDPVSGNWTVGGGGTWVNQSINGAPTFFVSPDTFINVIITGTVTNGNSDNDWVGIVFGYQEPVGNSTNYDCWLFDWKQGAQGVAQEGFSLVQIQGNIPTGSIGNYFWDHNSDAIFNVVATDYGAGKGWVQNVTHQITLVYTTTQITIIVDGDTIFDITGCFEPGRFGFYNYSQANVTYAGFDYQLKANYTLLTPQVCAGDTGLFQFVDTSCTDISGTIASWDWDFGDGNTGTDVNPTHVYANSGTYQVQMIVTDNFGCQDSITKSIFVNPLPVANLESTQVCLGISTSFADSSSVAGGSIVSWNWDFGDGSPIDNNQNPSHLFLTPDTFNTTLIVVSNNGCRDTITEPVIVYSLPLANFGNTTECPNDTTYFTDLSTVPNDSIAVWQWDFGDSAGTSIVQNPFYIYSSSGSYTTTLAVTSGSGCTTIVGYPVTVQPLPLPGFTNTTECANDATLFTDTSTVAGGSIISWQWDFGDGNPPASGQNTSHSYNTGGTYNVTLITTSNNGCVDSITKTIVVHYVPSANFNSTAVCFNDTTIFNDMSLISVDSIIAWQWDFGDGTGTSTAQNPTYTYSIPDTFTVTLTVTSDSGCTTVVGYPVEVFPLPVAGFATANVCLYDDAVFTDSSTISSGTINSWQWDFGDGNTSITQDPTNLYNTDGPYDVSLIVTSFNSCKDTIVLPIQIYPAPSAGFGTNNVCLYDDAVFADASFVSSGNIISWNWNFDDGNTSTTQDPTHPYLTDGTYNVSLVITTDNNCVDTVILPLIIYPVPSAGFTTGPICLDDAAIFTDVTTITPPDSVVLWDWNFGDGLGTSTIQNPSYNYGSEGLYNVQLNVISNNGCTDNTSLTIEIYPLPVVNFTSDKINGCAPLCVDFSDLTTVSGGTKSSWNWDFGDGGPDATVQNPSHCYMNNGQTSLVYDVGLTVITNQGCRSDSVIVNMIEIYPVPVAIFDFSPRTGTILNPFISFIDQSISNSIALWSWDFGDGDTSTITSPTHAYADTGTYLVELLVRNPFGCLDSVIRYIVIEGDYILFVPNAFTPNDDLINDTFFPQGIGIDESSFEMYIYDRWGDKVYETYNIDKPWDGRANDGRKIAQQGVYIWVIFTKDINEKRHKHVGHVTLIR